MRCVGSALSLVWDCSGVSVLRKACGDGVTNTPAMVMALESVPQQGPAQKTLASPSIAGTHVFWGGTGVGFARVRVL